MKITDRIKSVAAGIRFGIKRGFQSIDDIDKMLDDKIFGRQSSSGQLINTETACNFSAWFCGCLQISQTVASLPVIIYKIEKNSKRHYTELPLYNVMRYKANIRTSAYTWREVTKYHQLSWGNSYSYIERDRGRRVIGLWLLNPACMKKIHIMSDGRLNYEYNDPVVGIKIYDQDEILHIPGFGFDGIRGYSILTLARETIGLALSQEEFQARFYSRGTNIGGILTHPSAISQKARKNLEDSFNKYYGGVSNSHQTIVLEEGVKYEKTIMPLKDAQALESRVFSIQEVARWLNMPPHKLKELSKATYSNIEQEQSSYYQDTIRPHLERDEARMDMQLLPQRDMGRAYCAYDFNAILRADIKTRYEAYRIAREMGVMNADEWRDNEDWNPIGKRHGKAYILPLNYQNAERIMDKPVKEKPNNDMPNDNDDNGDNGKDIDNNGNQE